MAAQSALYPGLREIPSAPTARSAGSALPGELSPATAIAQASRDSPASGPRFSGPEEAQQRLDASAFRADGDFVDCESAQQMLPLFPLRRDALGIRAPDIGTA